jgi:hypothetical protein
VPKSSNLANNGYKLTLANYLKLPNSRGKVLPDGLFNSVESLSFSHHGATRGAFYVEWSLESDLLGWFEFFRIEVFAVLLLPTSSFLLAVIVIE